ncbi:MAG: hypothetical protein AAF458_00600 [Pseudomonadota bacterium]
MTNDRNTSRLIKFRIVGIACIGAGVVLALFPNMVGTTPPADSVFEAVEARARFGLWIAFGLFLLLWWRLRPWRLPVSAVLTALPVGYLVSRGIGVGFEGMDETQRTWIITEVVMALLMGGWHVWERRQAMLADAASAAPPVHED